LAKTIPLTTCFAGWYAALRYLIHLLVLNIYGKYGKRTSEPDDFYDPMEEEPQYRPVQIDDDLYWVEAVTTYWIHPQKEEATAMERLQFQHSAQVVVLTHNASSQAYFESMKTIYDRIPRPSYDPGHWDESVPALMQQDTQRKIPFKATPRAADPKATLLYLRIAFRSSWPHVLGQMSLEKSRWLRSKISFIATLALHSAGNST